MATALNVMKFSEVFFDVMEKEQPTYITSPNSWDLSNVTLIITF